VTCHHVLKRHAIAEKASSTRILGWVFARPSRSTPRVVGRGNPHLRIINSTEVIEKQDLHPPELKTPKHRHKTSKNQHRWQSHVNLPAAVPHQAARATSASGKKILIWSETRGVRASTSEVKSTQQPSGRREGEVRALALAVCTVEPLRSTTRSQARINTSKRIEIQRRSRFLSVEPKERAPTTCGAV